MARSGLRSRMLAALIGYAVLLTIAVFVHGHIVNEHAEQLVWQTLLDDELDHFLKRSREDPGFRWVNSPSISLHDSRDPAALPSALRDLTPGVHDDVLVDGGERVVLVRAVDGRRLMLSLDITALEAREHDMTLTVAGSSLTLMLLISLAVALGVDRLVKPLSDLARRIAALQPDVPDQQVVVADAASAELEVIANAINDYLRRNDRFVNRERAFIDSASHELRTPVAVIGAAGRIALDTPGLPPRAAQQLQRILRTTDGVERLIAMLLVLAKDPQRLARASDPIALEQLLPEIVEDHRHLTTDKDLTLHIAHAAPCTVVAPLPIVQTAIANLLRNAIENSDRGEIRITLDADATITIEDPGHGMSPEEISAIYATLARGGGERGGGIGIDLISRVCEHLGWSLDFESHDGEGTRTRLRLAGITSASH